MSASTIDQEDSNLLRIAVDLHRRGQFFAAEQRYRALLERDGVPPETGALLGLLLLDQGRLQDAEVALQAAIARDGGSALARSGLGTLYLHTRQWAEAATQLELACALSPADPDLHKNLGTARKNLGDVDGAVAAYRQGLSLRRSYEAHRPAPLAERTTNGVKLEHDRQQFELLSRRYPEREDFAAIGRALSHELAASEQFRQLPFQMVTLGPEAARRIGWFYNRLAHEPDVTTPDQVVARPQDLSRSGQAIAAGEPFVVIDDFLTPDALAGLRQLCEESTFWFEPKDHGGHVGAYLDEGFDHPLILAIAAETRAAMACILDQAVLKQAWAYKYDNRGAGTRIHADQAAYTLNLWITPDASNRDGGGGLTMTDVAAPDAWSFEHYNGDARAIETLLRERNGKTIRIPYRANRAVFFQSNYFHATEAFQFGTDYADRRINVSFMFGGVR